MSKVTYAQPTATICHEDRLLPERVIVDSARISYNGSFALTRLETPMSDKDIKLLKRLYKDKHMSPFEQVDITFEISCPIAVARQFHRHRTFSYNEASGRYRPAEKEFQNLIPLRCQSKINHQCSTDETVDDLELVLEMQDIVDKCFDLYDKLLSIGVAREQARFILPQGAYTFFLTKGNLRNWLHFLSLRIKDDAQLEIRVLAEQIAKQLEKHYPNVMEVFRETL